MTITLNDAATCMRKMIHDINNDLTAVLSYGELLQHCAHDQSTVREIADKLVSVANRVNSVNNELSDFSNKEGDVREPMNVSTVVSRCVDSVRQKAEQNAIQIDFKVPVEPISIASSSSAIQRILANVFENAFDAVYSCGDRRLGVVVSKAECGACIEVCDSGIGISPSDENRIFLPFYTTKQGSSGMGLASAYGQAEALGGQISVASKARAENLGYTTVIEIKIPDLSV